MSKILTQIYIFNSEKIILTSNFAVIDKVTVSPAEMSSFMTAYSLRNFGRAAVRIQT